MTNAALLICTFVASCHALVLNGAPPAHGTVACRSIAATMMAKKTLAKKVVSVILDADVEGVGTKGAVVEVKASYAENVLIRQSLGSRKIQKIR